MKKEAQQFEDLLKTKWNEANESGQITYRADTLSTRRLEHEGTALHLIHNACRDAYDRSVKAIDRPAAQAKPFAGGSNPELAETNDGRFKVVGNRFACVQYQCILVPKEPVEELTEEFLAASLEFAAAHPTLTLMYNALGAGKTVPQQFWLLSFAHYDLLADFMTGGEPAGTFQGLDLVRRKEPCYAVGFDFGGRVGDATLLLSRLNQQVGGKNFNMFLFNRRAAFIPRRPIETPTGFEGHRFGGLEMLGHFIMKSFEALDQADASQLLAGIREIGLKPEEQARFEAEMIPKQ